MKKSLSAARHLLLAFIMIPVSCSIEITEHEMYSAKPSEHSRLSINITGNGDTRSSISPDEEIIEDICVMAYRKDDGKLAASQSSGRADDISLDLRSGEYDIFVTANMEGFDAPADIKDMNDAAYDIASIEVMSETLPMCWSGTVRLAAGEMTTILVNLSRLVSKIAFNLDMGLIDGLEINSVRLCQSAGTIRPFMRGGSRILASDEAINGDYATQNDLQTLMSGGSIYFYAGENCQGQLLPDNTDPWEKVPGNIGEASDLCTYVEMTGKWNDMADYEGTILYRFYLGEDATTSFDIRRNSSQNLTVYLEESSFDRISWKIDVSQMDPIIWKVDSDFDNNFHTKNNFYVTENIRMDFSFDERGQKYWNKRNNDFSIVGMDYGGNTIIRFKDPVAVGNGSFYVLGTCVDSGDFDILMVNDQTGKLEYIMDYGTVHVPGIVADHHDYFSDNKVTGFDEAQEFFINGESGDICLYLVDKEGYNLNQGHYYGCDFTLCDWNVGIVNDEFGHDLYGCSAIRSYAGETGNDSYAVRYHIGFENRGDDDGWNMQLSESLGRGILDFTFKEEYSGASGKQPLDLYCDDISITFKPVPDEKRSLLQAEFMYVVENHSNLPLMIRGLKLNSMTGIPLQRNVRPVIHEAITGHTCTTPLLISKMPYSYCSLDQESARYTMINGERCYAADDYGIEQTDIPYQESMFHTIEARLAYESKEWSPEIIGTIDMYDTYAHSMTYGRNGYMNCGMMFHAYDDTYASFDSNNGLNTDFNDYGALLDKEHIDKFNNIVEVDISINDNNEIIAKASRSADLNISITGSLNGHIRCVSVQDPFYTIWGHYFTHAQKFSSNQSISLSSSSTMIDGGALAEAFEQMRQIPYYSVLDVWKVSEFRNPPSLSGAVREYLKPYGIELTISISSVEGLPVAVRFSGSTRYDYTTSAPVTWPTGLFGNATMIPSSYSGFDNRLDDDDCPPGELFIAETLYLQPAVTFSNTRNLYYMTR